MLNYWIDTNEALLPEPRIIEGAPLPSDMLQQYQPIGVYYHDPAPMPVRPLQESPVYPVASIEKYALHRLMYRGVVYLAGYISNPRRLVLHPIVYSMDH